jgi:hypothetical protein
MPEADERHHGPAAITIHRSSATVASTTTAEPRAPEARRARAGVQLALCLAAIVIVPFAFRAINSVRGVSALPPTYLPALEGPRERRPFDDRPIHLLRGIRPGYVIISDSMGGHIDRRTLQRLSRRTVAPLLQPASGSAWWYLALKNWVIASGVRPRCVFILFRDTNLTEPLFRIDGTNRWKLDLVARDREDEVNAVIAARTNGRLYHIRTVIARAYQTEATREWAEGGADDAVARLMIGDDGRREAFLDDLNDRLGRDHLRPIEEADIQATDDRQADFDKYVDASFLPLMLRDAGEAGIRLCFIRVQRRPVDGRPAPQSAALRRYIAQLEAYLQAHGAVFHDDTADPLLLAEELYTDGDHMTDRAEVLYTQNLYNRLRFLFP